MSLIKTENGIVSINGKAITSLNNYLENIELSSGFIDGGGVVYPASEQFKELYCEQFLDCNEFQDKIILAGVAPSTNLSWACTAFYDSDKNFKARPNSASFIKSNIGYIYLLQNSKTYGDYDYFRISFRGFDNPKVYAFDLNELIN